MPMEIYMLVVLLATSSMAKESYRRQEENIAASLKVD